VGWWVWRTVVRWSHPRPLVRPLVDRLMTEVPAQMAIPPKMDFSSNGWSLQ